MEKNFIGEDTENFHTDLAVEFGRNINIECENDVLKRSTVDVDKDYSKKSGKPVGRYITIESNVVKEGNKSCFVKVAEELAKSLENMMDSLNCLVVGLGNPDMTADSLGKRVLSKIMITRHLGYGKDMPNISGISPNVLGVTGIESFDIVKGVVDRIKPDVVLVVDSLAGATVGRIASAFQISNAGITPGSGVSNHRARLDKNTLGCQVISLGVPLVVYASTIIENATKGKIDKFDKDIGNMVVTPKDVDLLVGDCADIMARAINIAFFGTDFEGLV